MSTDDHHTLGRRHTGYRLLDHPLVGLERRRTALAFAYLGVLSGLFALSYAGTTVTIGNVALESMSTRFDTITAGLIALATATITVVPFLYAVWNGGPALAMGMPLVPVGFGYLAAGRYVLTVDAVIGLTVGAAACALALFATDVRRAGSLRPWRRVGLDSARLIFVTIATVVAAASVLRFVATTTPRSLEWYAPFGVLWLVPVCVLACYWQATIRTWREPRAADERVES
ncbi:hypothetical protein [Natronorubrum daqingense]|uniref:Uncharacterized protein n=1 Tax=Natronorubrum daqingense TaxID=588898 RepID=A0A1N7FAM3_9EURY|nr:hypothetical protein [Natronorubrum daqingense]APX97647.1 hypothetical protein BB347_14075 [Natronorubrum daqingense]SIR97275.1 hypothetical protein SAMN05421809_3140 [Natronorubrum daqingense]